MLVNLAPAFFTASPWLNLLKDMVDKREVWTKQCSYPTLQYFIHQSRRSGIKKAVLITE